MSFSNDAIYIAGQAKLPSETAAKQVYGVLCIGLIVESESGKILEASSTLLPPLENEFIRKLLVGKKIEADQETIIKEIRSRHISRASEAILAALNDLLKRFKGHKTRTRRNANRPSSPDANHGR